MAVVPKVWAWYEIFILLLVLNWSPCTKFLTGSLILVRLFSLTFLIWLVTLPWYDWTRLQRAKDLNVNSVSQLCIQMV